MSTLGVVLVLGGVAHTAGVTRLYVTQGVPDANRVLLDTCAFIWWDSAGGALT